MRVSDNANFGIVRDSIQRSKERLDGLQLQNATLKKLNAPSDDPVGAAKVLQVRSEKAVNDQFVSNGKLAEAFLNNSDHALEQAVELVNRAKEIAISQSSAGSSTDETRLGVAEEVSQLYQQAISIANTKIGDRYLFGGYKTNKPPFDGNGSYHGDEGQMMVEIGKGIFLSMNVSGVEAFNTHPLPNGAPGTEIESEALVREPASENARAETVNLFDELQNLRIGLLTGDLNNVRSTLDRFDQIHGQIVSTRSKIGSRLQGLESTGQAMERHNITNAQLTSNLEDADMAKVVSDLAREETVFRNALASSQKLIQPTLLEFLK